VLQKLLCLIPEEFCSSQYKQSEHLKTVQIKILKTLLPDLTETKDKNQKMGLLFYGNIRPPQF
jgi:hypothetical protein